MYKKFIFSLILLFVSGILVETIAQTPESEWAATRKNEQYKKYWQSLGWINGTYFDLQNDLKTKQVFEASRPNDSLILVRQFTQLDGKDLENLHSFSLEKHGNFVFLNFAEAENKVVELRLVKKIQTEFIFQNQSDLKADLKEISISREAKDGFKFTVKYADPTDSRNRSNFFRANDKVTITPKETQLKH